MRGRWCWLDRCRLPEGMCAGVAFAMGATGADLWGGEMTLGPWAWHPLTLSYLAIGSAMVSGTVDIPTASAP